MDTSLEKVRSIFQSYVGQNHSFLVRIEILIKSTTTVNDMVCPNVERVIK